MQVEHDGAAQVAAEENELVAVLEATLFLAGEPMGLDALRQVALRHAERRGVAAEVSAKAQPTQAPPPTVPRQAELALGLEFPKQPDPDVPEPHDAFERALLQLRERWASRVGLAQGIRLVEIAGGLALRTSVQVADVILSMREEKPTRLSRAALETLAIVAYQQPVTKPEVDQIRGVDSGGTVKALLDRDLVFVCGKKEEPGRPMLYATTDQFLSFFGLNTLMQLPTLRDYDELTEDSSEQLRAFDGLPSLKELSESAQQYRIGDAPEVGALDDAVLALGRTAQQTRDALLAQGVTLDEEDEREGPSSKASPVDPSTLN